MQEKYWTRLTQYKYTILYFDAHIARCVKINRAVKILIAVFSSTAIAAWVKWSQYAFCWGLIIVASQVIAAINEFLPYRNRVNELTQTVAELSAIYVKMEADWYYVVEGLWTEEEINTVLYERVSQWSDIESQLLREDSLPQIRTCMEFAETQKNDYFRENFGG